MKILLNLAAPVALLIVAAVAAADPMTVPIASLRGMGLLEVMGCIACAGGGATVLLAGPAAISAFIWSNTSLVATATCLAVCAEAL